ESKLLIKELQRDLKDFIEQLCLVQALGDHPHRNQARVHKEAGRPLGWGWNRQLREAFQAFDSEHLIHVGGKKAKHVSHARVGCYRLELKRHAFEQRSGRFGMIKTESKSIGVQGPRVEKDDKGERVLAHVPMGLVEKLKRDRDVLRIDIVDLTDKGDVRR